MSCYYTSLSKQVNALQKLVREWNFVRLRRINTLSLQVPSVSVIVGSRSHDIFRQKWQRIQLRPFHSKSTEIKGKAKAADDDLDILYPRIITEVKGHDYMVMQSYRKFVCHVAKELDVKLLQIQVPRVYIERRSLLRSVFIYKKHWTQYEMRTHFMVFIFKNLTGSTADTFLEYIQRNLPEGMAMKVIKERLEKFPEHLKTIESEHQHAVP